MESCQFRKLLLRKAFVEPEPTQMDSKRKPRVGTWHTAMIELMTTMSLHTMSVIYWGVRFAMSQQHGEGVGPAELRNMRINVGARLRAERKARNLSQADLERRTGLARCRISWLEHGRAIPTIETLEKISDALEIPVYRLLYDGDEPAQAATQSSKIATNGNRERSRKNAVRLLRELREQVSRMREDDQHLLLYIARKMAGRVRGLSGVEAQDIGRELNGRMTAGRPGGNS
jgi:transcriptional regulator with XRE-family HTH domain